MSTAMRHKIGEKFTVGRDFFSTSAVAAEDDFRSVKVRAGDTLTIIGYGLTGWVGTRGYCLRSDTHGILPGIHPNRLIENYLVPAT